jgi:hypothetical protein
LEVHDHPHSCLFLWVNKDAELRVTKKCKNKFFISENCINEVDIDVPLDMRGVVFRIPYMYMRDMIFTRRENQYFLIKDEKSFIKNAHKGKSKIFLVSANRTKKLVNHSKKFVLLFLRDD